MAIEIKAWEAYRVIWLRMEAGPERIDILLQAGRLDGKRMALVELQAEHNQLSRFITAVRQAIQPAASDGKGIDSLSEPVDGLSVWISMINQISELDQPLILILTGYDRIVSQEVHEAVTELLDYQPDALQIILFCQASPPLPLARLRARRALLEVSV